MLKSFKMKIVSLLVLMLWGLSFSQPKEIKILSDLWDGGTNADGSGFYYDLVRKVYEPEGIKVTVAHYPYVRTVNMVKNKAADAWVGAYPNEIEEAYFPKNHFDYDIVTAIVKKGAFPNWQGESSLENKNVGWLRGYEYDQYLTTKMNFKEFDNRESTIQMVIHGRLDAYLDAEHDIETLFEKKPSLKGQIDSYTILKLPLYIGFAKNEKGKELMEIWDKRINEMKANGELKKFYEDGDYVDYPF